MAIITRSFKITTSSLQDVFTFDTDATILGITKSSINGIIYTRLFDTTNTGYDIVVSTGSTLVSKTTVFIPQNTVLRYTSVSATASTPEYFNITYYYEDSSTDTINPVGIWNSTTTYAKNSIVYRDTNNTSYIANVGSVNKPPESSPGYWQILVAQAANLNINLSSELISDTTGFLTTNTTTLAVGSTLTNKTLAGTTRFSNNRIYDSTGIYYYELPIGSGQLVDTGSDQTLSGKTFENCQITASSMAASVNFQDNSKINLINSYAIESVLTLTFSSNTLTIFPLRGLIKTTTPATADATLTITLPAVSSINSGTSMLIFITMAAANQQIIWSNVKVASSVAASNTANSTDIYSVINDGTFWYLTLLDKGFI
jgi:hypothetical protein